MASSCLPGKDDLRRSWKRLVLKGQEEREKKEEWKQLERISTFHCFQLAERKGSSLFDGGMIGNCTVHIASRALISLWQLTVNNYHPPQVAFLSPQRQRKLSGWSAFSKNKQ